MKKIYSLIALAITSLGFAQNDTLINHTGSISSVYNNWAYNNNVTSQSIAQTGNNGYLLLEAGNPGDVIVSAPYDVSNYSELKLKMNVATYGNGATNNPVKVEVSYDNGVTFTQEFLSTVPTSSSYVDSGEFTLNNVSENLVLKFTNNGTSGKGVRLKNILLTGELNTPAPTASITDNLTNFSYVVGSGPSLIQDLTITLENITATDNVTIEFEDDFYDLVAFDDVDFENGANVIQIQLKDDLTVGIYNTTLNVLINGELEDSIELDGEVTPIPVSAEFTEEGLEIFSYEFGAEESETQTIVLTVENLLPNQTLTVLSENSNFEIVNPTAIVNGENNIVVRLVTGLAIGEYEGNIIVSLGDTLLDNIELEGEVTDVLSNTKNEIEGLNIFPNPSNDIVTIASNSSAVKTVQLFDMLGKKVLEVETENTINVSTINKGIYTLKVTQEGKVSTSKLVVK